MTRLRILPFLIALALATLVVKIGNFWTNYPTAMTKARLFDSIGNPALASVTGDKTNSNDGKSTDDKKLDGKDGGDSNAKAKDPTDLSSNNNSLVNAKAELPSDPTRFSQSEIDLLQALSGRRDELDAREKTISQRELTLKAAEKRLTDKVTALEGMKAELIQLINRRNQADDDRLRKLVKIYENMKPKDAAQILARLDTEVAIGVIERMKEFKIAPVLASMDPARAEILTSLLADRQSASATQNSSGSQNSTGFKNATATKNNGTNASDTTSLFDTNKRTPMR